MSLYSVLCEVSGSLTANGKASANGNVRAAPESAKVTEGTISPWFASPYNPDDIGIVSPHKNEVEAAVEVTKGTISPWFACPYNPDDIGIVPLHKNEVEAAVEVTKQLPPSFTYEGPLGGAGPLGLFAPKPGSAEYNAYVVKQKAKEKYNPETIGVTPLAENEKTSAIEIGKQTEGTHFWEQFVSGVKTGYTREPEDVNVFTKSVTDAGKALTGVVDPSNYLLLGIAGAVLLLILIIK